MPSVLHNPTAQRFEMQVGGKVAFVGYSVEGNHVILEHTHVPETVRGRGVAAQLVRAALAHARQQGWNVTAHCTYAAEYLRRHPESAGVIAGPARAGDQRDTPNLQ